MSLFSITFIALCFFPFSADAVNEIHADLRGRNLLTNPSFEQVENALPKGWAPLGEKYQYVQEGREGGHCMKCHADKPDALLGAEQDMVFDPPIQHPIQFSAWSKTSGMEGRDYYATVLIFYADGTADWNKRIYFSRMSGDWEFAEKVFQVEKPIKRLAVRLIFNKAKGTVWFDDVKVALAPHTIERSNIWGGMMGNGKIVGQFKSAISSTWKINITRERELLYSQQGEGIEQMLHWNGKNPNGQDVTPGKCNIEIEATDEIFGKTISLKKETNSTSIAPGRHYALWVENSMKRVLPEDLPESESPISQISLSAARNESESAQIIMRPPQDTPLRNVRARVSDLSGGNGTRIEAKHLQWHQVSYVKIEEQAKDQPFLRESKSGWLPDPLLPVEKFDVEGAWTQPIWITVHVPHDTAPGIYQGQITISADGNTDAVVPITLKVHSFSIPVEGHLKNTFALMQGYLEKMYGKEKLTPALRQKYGNFLLEHRLNPDDITRTDLPFIEDLELYNKRGLNTFNVLNLVEPRKGEWNCFSPVSYYTPQFKQSVIEKLDPYISDLKKRGLHHKAYIHGFDERQKEYYPIIREYFCMAKERYGLPTLTTAVIPQNPQVMRDLHVDWLCPLTDVYSFENAERCRKEGLQIWGYVCMGPRFPYANFLADDPLIEARVIMWQSFHQKFDGFLYWGVNVWWHKNTHKLIQPENGAKLDWSITTEQMKFLHGDGVLIYPLTDGPAGSIRLSNIRDGLEDYECLWALGQKRGDVWSARADCESVTTSLTSFTIEPNKLLETKEKILSQISP